MYDRGCNCLASPGCYDVVDVDVQSKAKKQKATTSFRWTDLDPDGIRRIGPRKRS